MRHGQVPAEDVVDGNRALAAGGRSAVHEHYWCAPSLQASEGGVSTGHGRDQHALHPVLLKQLQVAAFLAFTVVAVAENHSQARLADLVLNAPREVGEEWVGHIEHNQPDRPAAPGAELTRRLVPD